MIRQLNFIFSFAFVFVSFPLFAKESAPKEWTQWKEKLEKSYEGQFSSPTYTHHVYLNKKGEMSFIDLTFKYPRFVKKQCKNCFWSIHREGDDQLRVKNKKSKKSSFALPVGKETLIPGEKKKYLSAFKDESSNEIRVFLHDLGLKDLDKKRKRELFSYNKKMVFEGTLKWLSTQRKAKIQRSDGSVKEMPIVAEISFQVKGKPQILSVYNYEEKGDAYKEEEIVMLLFRDLSNGKKTYGAGRFLNLYLPKKLGQIKEGEKVNLDFNFSYNPPCAVSTGFHCPLPQDLVQKEILVGEKYLHFKK